MFAIAISVACPSAADTTLACDADPVTVTAPTEALATGSCVAAHTGLALLARCGLSPASDIRIAVVPNLDAAYSAGLARFDRDTALIEVLSPDALRHSLTLGSRFAALPVEELFDSLIAHELTHAVLEQQAQATPLQRQAREYLAYAMQLSALPAASREAAFGPLPDGNTIDVAGFNLFVLAMAPDAFAVWAYSHFHAEGNGCGLARMIVEGQYRFPWRQ